MGGLPEQPEILSSEIRRYARGALAAADITERTPLPIPIADIATAAGLHRDVLFALGEEEDLPPGLAKVLKKLRGKVVGALSMPERRLYVDASLPSGRARFTEAHEIGHDALPWHRDAYFGDDKSTLEPATRALLEREANAFATEVLFGLDRFKAHADDFRPTISVPMALHKQYGASLHAALRRYVEDSEHELALIIAGRYLEVRGQGPGLPIWGLYESGAFRKRFDPLRQALGHFLTADVYPSIDDLLPDHAGQVPACTVTLDTRRGSTPLIAEGYRNGRSTFVLLRRRKVSLGRTLQLIGVDGRPLR